MEEYELMKISPDGKLHPLQLQVDKVQFFLNKMFEFACLGKSKYNIALELFLSEATELFLISVAGFIRLHPKREQKRVTEEILNHLRTDLYRELEISPSRKKSRARR